MRWTCWHVYWIVGVAGCIACTRGTERRSSQQASNDSVRPTAPALQDRRVDATIPDTVPPPGPLGDAIRRGRAILRATHDSLPAFARSELRCVSCHLDDGLRSNAIPLIGVHARYPKYMDRTNAIVSIEDRVNGCFSRSLAGRPIPTDSREMHDIVAYLAFISKGFAVGSHVAGEGLPVMPRLTADTGRGAHIYASRCAICHGTQGEGIAPNPPLWGARSYAIGASMAREERAASFIQHNMPFDKPGTLSNQEAYDVASYVLTHVRPNTPGKEHDWPRGGAPYDVPYETAQHVAYKPPRSSAPR
jgi:thiosulfate dehydrogenase